MYLCCGSSRHAQIFGGIDMMLKCSDRDTTFELKSNGTPSPMLKPLPFPFAPLCLVPPRTYVFSLALVLKSSCPYLLPSRTCFTAQTHQWCPRPEDTCRTDSGLRRLVLKVASANSPTPSTLLLLFAEIKGGGGRTYYHQPGQHLARTSSAAAMAAGIRPAPGCMACPTRRRQCPGPGGAPS